MHNSEKLLPYFVNVYSGNLNSTEPKLVQIRHNLSYIHSGNMFFFMKESILLCILYWIGFPKLFVCWTLKDLDKKYVSSD